MHPRGMGGIGRLSGRRRQHVSLEMRDRRIGSRRPRSTSSILPATSLSAYDVSSAMIDWICSMRTRDLLPASAVGAQPSLSSGGQGSSHVCGIGDDIGRCVRGVDADVETAPGAGAAPAERAPPAQLGGGGGAPPPAAGGGGGRPGPPPPPPPRFGRCGSGLFHGAQVRGAASSSAGGVEVTR